MKSRIPKGHWLRTTKIAHRGLWGDAPENSLTAFENAARENLAIEIDVHISSDGHVIIHHDDTLTRMTGLNKKITDCTLSEIKEQRLLSTDEKVPILTELLPIAKNRSPLLIEIKSTSTKVGVLEKALYDIVKDYDGEFAVQSFNPLSVKWFKDNAPDILRGQLATKLDEKSGQSKFNCFMLNNLLLNGLTKPDFVSFDQKYMPKNAVERERKKGREIIAWTVTSKSREEELKQYCDNIIFESYLPDSFKNNQP